MSERPTVDPRRTVKASAANFPLEDGLFPDFGEPGGIENRLDFHMVMLACPGCGRVSGMNVASPKPTISPSWDIVAGSLEDVTTLSLSPSINCVGCCKWHGYLTAGEFKSC